MQQVYTLNRLLNNGQFTHSDEHGDELMNFFMKTYSCWLSKREFYRSLEEVGLRFTASEQLAVWKAFVNGASGLVYARVEWRDYQRVGLALLEQQHAKRRSRRQMADPPDQQKLLRLFTHVAQQNEVRPPVEPTVHLAWAGGAWAGRSEAVTGLGLESSSY